MFKKNDMLGFPLKLVDKIWPTKFEILKLAKLNFLTNDPSKGDQNRKHYS